jgi:ABC-type nickel/cobalt efflux system permease component RcnA
VGLGVAGGLVPSPSALIVLLGAIALGRTWFGVALVLAYGVGMAGTLTATGLLLVKLAGRLSRVAARSRGVVARLSAFAPVGTAAVVMLLGLGLVLRSLIGTT